MKKLSCLLLLHTVCVLSVRSQNVGIGTSFPVSRLHAIGTSWFQGDNTPLGTAAGSGIGIGYSSGATGGYIFGFNYSTFTARDLWLQGPGGSVLINSYTASPAAKLHVEAGAGHAIYGNTINGYGLLTQSSNAGVVSSGGYIGVQGAATGSSTDRQGIRGEAGSGAGGYAGLFQGGSTWVVGTLMKTAGSFVIDHPLEPATKYLVHSFVESPDMKNIYDGVITTDANGNADISLPSWFQALNMEFRYQLTCMGQFAQAIVLDEIKDNHFTIKTDKPLVKVSWQVTGIRHDPYAEQNRLPVEKLKRPDEAGKYIYPKGYNLPESMCLDIMKPLDKK